jgi:hypothetical protein
VLPTSMDSTQGVLIVTPVAGVCFRSHMGLGNSRRAMDQRSTPERPRSEPEILPPERGDAGPLHDARWERAGAEGIYRVRVVKLGPVGATLLAIGIGVASAALLMLVLGTLLILIPVVGLLIAGAIIAGILRGYFRAR